MANPHAQTFAALHAGPDLLVLPNAWDAVSALLAERAGAKAIATSSALVAWSHGYPDGDALPLERHLSSMSAIARVIGVPLSVDFEGGYADDAATVGAHIGRVIDAGAVAINIEDGTAPADRLCAKIAAARTVAAAKGVPLWINARTDVFLKKLTPPEAMLAETLARARRYIEAGADSIFVPAVLAEADIATLVAELRVPLNVIALPGLPPLATLQQLGVRRLSAGPGWGRASYNHAFELASAFLADGRPEPFSAPPLTSPDYNAMMKRD